MRGASADLTVRVVAVVVRDDHATIPAALTSTAALRRMRVANLVTAGTFMTRLAAELILSGQL